MTEPCCPNCGIPHDTVGTCLAGRTLLDGLHVRERLGQTRFGPLYRADYLDRAVSVDIVLVEPQETRDTPHASAASSSEMRDLLSRAAGIKHPNVASIGGMNETPEGVTYVVCEILQGQLMSEVLDDPELPLDHAVDIILQAAAGLQASHAAGLLHGNLSPDAILVTSAPNGHPVVKLIRFGLVQPGTARFPGIQEAAEYGAPEGAAGQPIDEWADIYSLGAVLCRVLTVPQSTELDRRGWDQFPRLSVPC
jgi:serine/threonine protein kinase